MSIGRLNYKFVRSLFRIYAFLAIILFLFQDLFLFPALQGKIFLNSPRSAPPDDIESFFVDTSDGKKLEVWTTYGKTPNLDSKYIGLIFHGNGETVAQRNFLPFFARHGIGAFTFDYRGYGNSTGWPSEDKIFEDSETIYQAIIKKTGVSSDKIVILGNSIGSGPASYLASKVSPHALILLAAFTSIRDVVSERWFYRPFLWLLRYDFPNKNYLANMQARCVIMAHGRKDQVISFSHLELLRNSLNPEKVKETIVLDDPDASHDNIYYAVEDQLDASLDHCLLDTESAQ